MKVVSVESYLVVYIMYREDPDTADPHKWGRNVYICMDPKEERENRGSKSSTVYSIGGGGSGHRRIHV